MSAPQSKDQQPAAAARPAFAPPSVEQRDAESYVAVRRTGRGDDGFRAAVDSGYPELFGALAEHGVEPSGPPFIGYELYEDGGPFEIELAVTVTGWVAGDERLHAGVLPAGRYATYLHRGAYLATTPRWEGLDLAAAHAHVHAWAAAEGVAFDTTATADGTRYRACVERYLVGPPFADDPETWQTELAFLIRD